MSAISQADRVRPQTYLRRMRRNPDVVDGDGALLQTLYNQVPPYLFYAVFAMHLAPC